MILNQKGKQTSFILIDLVILHTVEYQTFEQASSILNNFGVN